MLKRIWIITLFPEYFIPFLEHGVAGKALRNERAVKDENTFELKLLNLRDFALNKYKSVDDTSYGGGAGMVMLPDVLKNALFKGVIEAGAYGEDYKKKLHVVFPSPRGKTWTNEYCKDFATRFYQFKEAEKDLVFICGRYEGIDERFIQNYVDEQMSVGDFILTGGELAVLSILDSSLRYVPGVLGNKLGAQEESFENFLLEQPQYTKPREFESLPVPEELVSGHHENILKYQLKERERLTKLHRPDLWEKYLKGIKK
ncbi:MAG: tRNA (guanosine(37)-N1)-methyltransferase TrmD [Bacteriovoracaceae bacterium]